MQMRYYNWQTLRWSRFFVRKNSKLHYKEISQEDNRLSVIQLINNKKVLVTLIGVYLPYFCASSTPQYNETLEKIHAIAETLNSLNDFTW